MTRKQKTGLFLGIFIPLGVVDTVATSLLLIFIILLAISLNWPYHIHRQAILQQTNTIFEDSEGHVYHGLASYDSDSLYVIRRINPLTYRRFTAN
jgi:cell division protein FtsL